VLSPRGNNLSAGETIVLSARAAGMQPMQYRWLKNGVPLPGTNRWHGVDTDTLTIPDAQIADSGAYAVEFSNPRGTVLSQTGIVTITAQ
jgi:hypothetical protein